MANFDNLSEINENFDTIKTLLNSIRAQGILNTSDVDKLLSGINSKLERLNTEEDIDLIKIFLSELKQNFEERHGVLVSKFAAIESLFTNLLKNSSEMPKSAELKELFDIVATNLSVFSREVVSQKESLTEISLRLEALRTDDSQKKDIIKNIAILKSDLERLSNGFDSIVISLNDNFKTLAKTITSIDKTEYLDRFSDSLSSIEMSSNTVLSALQLLGKKTEQVEDALTNLATKDDITSANQRLFELSASGQEMSAYMADLNSRYTRLDSLAEKIDASVNIIATLKSVMEENEDKNARSIIEELRLLEADVKTITEDTTFEEFKLALEGIFKKIIEGTAEFEHELKLSNEKIQSLSESLKDLNIGFEIQNISKRILDTEENIKSYIDENSQKLNTLNDANITRVINDVVSNADLLGSKLNQAQTSIATLCERNFGSVYENLTALKTTISQLDENTVSANNAIFSSITDRLTVFENSLRNSLDLQEKTVNTSSAQLIEQIENIKNLSGVLDYKIDSSVVEVNNVKREFSTLKEAVEEVLALDFVNTVKDLRVDLYATKQEIVNNFENSNNELSEKFTTDLYGKYELLISKLDSVEDEIKNKQAEHLAALKPVLENITSSLVDVLSYVSEKSNNTSENFDAKFSEISNTLENNTVSFIENVKDIADTLKLQIENNLKNIEENNIKNLEAYNNSLKETSEDIKKDIKFSYSKLLEIQDAYNEIKDIININSINSTDKFDGIIASTNGIRTDFESKINLLKNIILDKITEFKQEFTFDNAEKVNELKLSVESLYSKGSTEVVELLNSLKEEISGLSTETTNSRTAALAKILDGFVTLKDHLSVLESKSSENLNNKIIEITKEFSQVKTALEKLDENVDADITRQLSILESNFETLMSQITILFDKSELTLTDKINNEFENISEKVATSITTSLEDYKLQIEKTFSNLENKTISQSEYLQKSIVELNEVLKSSWVEQADTNSKQFEEIANKLNESIDSNKELTTEECAQIRAKLNDWITIISDNNNKVLQDLSEQIKSIEDDIVKKFSAQDNTIIENFTVLKNNVNSSYEKKVAKLLEIEEIIRTSNNTNIENIELTRSDVAKTFEAVNILAGEQQSFVHKNDECLANLTQAIDKNKDLISSLDTNNKQKFEELASNNIVLQQSISEVIVGTQSINEILSTNKNDISALAQAIAHNKVALSSIDDSLAEKMSTIKAFTSEAFAGELQAIDAYINLLQEEIANSKKITETCKELILQTLKKELNFITQNIEKETDAIISELVEQFDLLKKDQSNGIIELTTRLDEIVNTHIYDNIEDLKSYLDVKTDNSNLVSKVDNLKVEMTNTLSEVLSNISKMLDAGIFNSALSDFRTANEILINSSIDRLSDKFESFINENIEDLTDIFKLNTKSIEERLGLFDKKFVDTVVDKFEEIKIVSNQYSHSLEQVQQTLSTIISDFGNVKNSINDRLDELSNTIIETTESTNKELAELNKCFSDLRSQISSKSFDEAFQASINKQIADLEKLLAEQFEHIEDINELCANNLPDVTELNTLVKHTVLESINNFSSKLDNIQSEIADINTPLNDVQNSVQDIEYTLEKEVKELKSEVITQILNVFNQISFITEQEEILDFIQDKHDELIEILSHIVTSTNDIYDVKKQVSSVDKKMTTIKDEINSINNKINAIISADGNVDYIYSLHDLESDIAGLRLALNEVIENNHSKELIDLVNSTDEIYALVETIKEELPSKKAFENISEDIVSISTRTNKLILASDESYKTLQENLQDFKLVIDDLDERTRNFSKEAGLDRIDHKLNAINTMMINGSKTNQVFNQVFEYLAEWVDNAGNQINAISDKVDSLDEISQIKTMIYELKSEAADNTETVELVEALGNVFNKQNQKIASLDTKLDRIIVENTINKDKKIDMTPLEDTLNRFLVTIDEKINSQQEKISSLEAQLKEIMSGLDENDTTQLTKKVGGMDRQIAKLNKSIEKIASHVIEK